MKTKRGMFDPFATDTTSAPRPPARVPRKRYPYEIDHATVGVCVDRRVKKQLQAIAKARQTTISALIRVKVDEILTEYDHSLSTT